MLMDLEDEYMRRGTYERCYPEENNVDYYEQFFEHKRYETSLVAAYMRTPKEKKA